MHVCARGRGFGLLETVDPEFFARSLGERDFHAYEAVQLGLQLPLVLPMMPIVSLNTSGSRPLKPQWMMKYLGENEPVHYDSKVDKFNKRLQLVKKQIQAGIEDVSEAELQHVSLYEFWWKYFVDRGRVKRSTRPVCLMVTPSYSADCANVEHACHESYARTAVLAHWRHMQTTKKAQNDWKCCGRGARSSCLSWNHRVRRSVR